MSQQLTNKCLIYENLILILLFYNKNLSEQGSDFVLNQDEVNILETSKKICNQYRKMQELKKINMQSYSKLLPSFLDIIKNNHNKINIFSPINLNYIIVKINDEIIKKKLPFCIPESNTKLLGNFLNNLNDHFNELKHGLIMQQKYEISMTDIPLISLNKSELMI